MLILGMASLTLQSAGAVPADSPYVPALGDRISSRLGLPSQEAGSTRPEAIVTIVPRLSRSVTPAGDSVQLRIVAMIADGWHVNSHRPTLDFLVPTRLTLRLPNGVTSSDIIYPTAIRKTIPISDRPLELYEGDALFTATLHVEATVPAGSYRVRGRLDYQPCNATSCLAPTATDFEVELVVAAPSRGRRGSTSNARLSLDSPDSETPTSMPIPSSPPVTSQARDTHAEVESGRSWFMALITIAAVAVFIVGWIRRR
jgi:DsbC/DsbD-like thiol-disulfide interchange protein